MRITQQVSATCHGCRRRRSEVRFVAVAADTSAERSEAREDGVGPNATFRVASPLVMATRGSCVKWNDGCLALGACSRFMGARKSSHYLLLRRGVVPHDTTIDADIDCSGFASLRLRSSRVRRCGGSRHICVRRCGGSLWCCSRQSEQRRRSRTKGSPRRLLRALRTERHPRESEQRRRSRTKGSPRRQLRALKMEPGGFAPPSRYVLPIASTSVFVLSISPRSSAHDERQTSASLAVVSFLCGQAALWNQPGF